jgi:hypothetical protein
MGQQTISGQLPSSEGPGGAGSLVTDATARTGVNDAAFGSAPWTVTTGGTPAVPVYAQYAQPAAGAVSSQGLACSNFGFNIPATATILSAQVSFYRGVLTTAIAHTSVVRLIGVTGTSNNLANSQPTPSWTTVAQLENYTASPANWNVALTPTIVNASTFGFELAAVSQGGGSADTPTIEVFGMFISYSLPGVQGIVIADASANDFATSQWTQGAVSFFSLPVQPDLARPWSIISFSLVFIGTIYQPNSIPSYGQLGTLWAGLLFNQITPPNYGEVPWENPMPPFPSGSALISELWDGGSDACFPFTNSATLTPPPRYLTYSNPLPVPVTMQPGENLSLALWLTPSLAQNAQILISNATYELVYDDTPHS